MFVFLQHEDICKFPSSQFYEGRLKTGLAQPISTLCDGERVLPFVFGHVEGTTVSLVVSTAKGNENSKANKEEMKTVVSVWYSVNLSELSEALKVIDWCWCECQHLTVKLVNVCVQWLWIFLLLGWHRSKIGGNCKDQTAEYCNSVTVQRPSVRD